jgi:LuxR family maltose regulon positive regulatory protein
MRENLLIASKLCIPPVRSRLLLRPRLNIVLDQAAPVVLTLVSAPAGFGKSGLLTTWARGQSHPVAWVSLDIHDNDPVRFWNYLLSALEARVVGLAKASLAMLRAPRQLPIQAVLTPLINRLIEHDETITLILDDYHTITQGDIHDALAWLLEQLPATCHVIIATRTEPPLPLERWRAHGQLCELRAAELRFTREEIAAWFEMMGLTLTEQTLHQCEARTEGWIAGLQLVTLMLRESSDPRAVLDRLSGGQRHIMDYLLSEVLEHQPDERVRFLLDTTILKSLCGPLCDAVTERQQSQAMLEELEAANLFLFPLDTERRWYRYHQLFAEALSARLRRDAPERISTLHRRACRWFMAQGLIGDAIDHALAGDDFAQALHLVESAAPVLAGHGELATLEGWLAALPKELSRTRPRICAMHAWVRLSHGQLEAAAHWLALATEAVSHSPKDVVAQGEVAVVAAGLAAYRADIGAVVSQAQQALDCLPEAHGLRSMAALALAGQHVISGQVAEAAQAFDAVVRMSRATESVFAEVYASYQGAEARMLQGKLHEAAAVYREIERTATLPSGQQLPLVGFAYIGLGELQREWNMLDAAETLLTKGVALVQQVGELAAADGLIAIARIQQARGQYDVALRTLEDAVRLVEQQAVPEARHLIGCYKARCWLSCGDHDRVKRWMREASVGVATLSAPVAELTLLTLARAELAFGQFTAALRRLIPLKEPAFEAGRMVNVMQLLVLQALAYAGQGRMQRALTALGSALALAEAEGFMRLFLDEGAPLAALLVKLRAAHSALNAPGGQTSGYLDKLLAAFESELGGAQALPAPLEPLSAREQQVLRHIAMGASNKQIAQALEIAPSTVKWYVNGIFGKLQVTSRTQAVARAREVGLL